MLQEITRGFAVELEQEEARSPWAALSDDARAEQAAGRRCPPSRDDRSASSIRLIGRVETMTRMRLAQDGRRHDVEELRQPSFARRPHHGELFEQLVQAA